MNRNIEICEKCSHFATANVYSITPAALDRNVPIKELKYGVDYLSDFLCTAPASGYSYIIENGKCVSKKDWNKEKLPSTCVCKMEHIVLNQKSVFYVRYGKRIRNYFNSIRNIIGI